ncbi:MAG: hypothetical protein J0653_01235, partial [Deltaproteobacteria bacterium]|nr:hypothetical protein [Deltaproteobacteria bacterium]
VEDFLTALPQKGYEVVAKGLTPSEYTVQNFFKLNSPIHLKCDFPSKPIGTPQAATGSKFVDAFRLTGKLEDLTRAGGKKLKNVEAAKLSFRRDEETSTDVFNVNGIVGFEFGATDTLPSFTPYVHYQRTDTDADDNDKDSEIESLTAGIQVGDLLSADGIGSLTWGVSSSFMFDLEQNSEAMKLKAFIDPSPNTGDFLLGKSNKIGPFLIRPSILLLAEGGHVFDAGKSDAFDDQDDYFGLGGEAFLKIGFEDADLEFLSGLSIFVTYRHLEL